MGRWSLGGAATATVALAQHARTILVADADPVSRAGVRHALEPAGWSIVAEVDSARGALSIAVRRQPAVVLVDVRLPGGGVDAALRITEQAPQCVVVMRSASLDGADFLAAVQAGAVGYLAKDVPAKSLVQALDAVLAGEAALPRAAVRSVLDQLRVRARRRTFVDASGRRSQLSDREWDVVELMEQGCSTAEMARRLFIAPVTVRSHVAAARRKLRAPDRDAAVRLVGASRRGA